MGTVGSRSRDEISEELLSDASLSPSSFPSPTGKTVTVPPSGASAARTVGYAVYGDEAAPPARTLLFLHGTPGTRLFFTQAHSAHAARHTVRVLAPERPGFGLSAPQPARTLLSAAADAAAVLDAEGVEAAHVLGYSAGGPFALAFAYRFPARCGSVAVVSGLSPNVSGVTNGMTALSKFGYFLAARAPRMLTLLVRMMVADAQKEVFDDRRADFTEEENAQFRKDRDVRRCFAESTLELYSREYGAVAEAEDYVLMAKDWGFRLEDLEGVDVFLYGGSEDNKCTVGMFRELERGLSSGNCNLKKADLVGGENHLYFYRLFVAELFEDMGLAT